MSTPDIVVSDVDGRTISGPVRRSPLPRIAALAGFAGAVVMLGALLSLFARLWLDADAAALPSLSASASGLVLGAVLRLICRPLAERQLPPIES